MLGMPAAVDVPLRTEDGVIRVGRSRVTLDAVIADFHGGASPEEIARHYSALHVSDVYLVIGYYLRNQADIDAYIDAQERLAADARRRYEADHPNDPLRERLIAALAEKRNPGG
ncbi:MAG: DUF433 domain-containing protein [Anaerolineae bacterium]|nr:DUF433 domain-containing protein [Anaerolineae bacterium]